VANQHISLGRALSESDDTHRLFNCVVGWAVYESLFPRCSPSGRNSGRRQAVQVVGVLARPNLLLGQNERTVGVIPTDLEEDLPRDEWVS
jgi:hypothetical protein